MKKIYLGAFVSLFAAGASFAQVVEEVHAFDNNKIAELEQAPSDYTTSSKALGVTFWTNDFSTAADWTAANDGQASPFGWNVGSTVNSWWAAFSGGINSTSGGNFAEVYNGDYNVGDQAIDVVYTLTTAAPIDVMTLGGTDQVTLSFEQFGALFNDGHRVLVSTDGTNFEEVYTNNDRTVFVGNNPSAVFANPETVTANIAPFIAGGASSVWIQFEWTSRITGNTTPTAWTTFGWFIDDVALTTNPDNDISAESPVWGSLGLKYHQIPVSQQTDIEFTTNARNNGINTQTDVQLNVDITGAATFGATSPTGVDIVAGAYDSLITQTFLPTGLGTYNVEWELTQNEIDDVPTDNVNAGFSFDVTQYTYARDEGTQTGTFSNQGDLFILGSYYDCFANDNLYSVDVTLSSAAVVGSIMSARVYSLDPAATTFDAALILEDQSMEYTIQAGDPGSEINLDFIFNGLSGFPIVAGETYFVAISSDGDGGTTDGVVIGTAGTADAQTCFTYDGPLATWFYTTNTPMIRMNLDPASSNVGLDENGILFGAEVFPNPTTENLSVRYTLGAASDVAISVVDLTGKEVAAFAQGTKAEGTHQLDIDASTFAEGLYYVTIVSGDSSLTKKIVKK